MIYLENSCFARMICGKSVKADFHSSLFPLLLFPVRSRQKPTSVEQINCNLTLSDLTFEMLVFLC